MKITFLGTGHGVPSGERSCASTMIEVADALYLVDAGASVSEKIMQCGREITDVRSVFTTHAHTDHVAGIFHLADLYNWRYRDSEIDIFMTEESVVQAFDKLLCVTTRELDRARVKFHTVTHEFLYDDGNVRVSLYPTKHLEIIDRPSYGVLFESDGKRIYFSGDLSQHIELDDFPPVHLTAGADLFVCELAHFTIDEVRPYLERCGARRVAFTHVYPLSKYEEMRTAFSDLDFELLAPSDMDELEL